MASRAQVEWPTIVLIGLCYTLWGLALFWAPDWSLTLAILLVALTTAMHSSLQHEVTHCHPFSNARANYALVWLPLGLFIPFERFRDTHLAHHQNALLTDPYDDPESNYLDPEVWARLPRVVQVLLRLNNTLLGRIVLGPAIGQVAFMCEDVRRITDGDRDALFGWARHVPPLVVVLGLVWAAPIPVWAYLLGAYAGAGILKIRTFLEHQAHERTGARSVIIEDRGPLALLFLNNNLHVVHHMHPRVPWYRLPALYAANKARYLRRNEGYRYRSYAEVFARHLLRAKDPVPHPLWRGGPGAAP